MVAGPEARDGGARTPWWRGSRGEWYVATQLFLMALVFFGPRTLPGLPPWPPSLVRISTFMGAALGVGGLALLLAGLLRLGPNLTPLPYPKSDATFVSTGPYGLVRHPMYAGGILLAIGWALVVHGWLTLVYTSVLVVVLDIKSAREERWLVEKFADYRDYQRRVHKLIPFIR